MIPPRKKRIIFIVGPTAVGKSEAAASLAKKINAEIISCDSMQVYKGMDIITSKPSLRLRKAVPHHLIDIVYPDAEYNVSKYRLAATKKIREIIGRGKVPIFAGGTGLYVSALVDGIFRLRTEDQKLRKRLYKQAKERGSQYLHARLKKVDPVSAAKIHPHDTKRVVRALEVFMATGKPISVLQKQKKGLTDGYEVKIFCLDMRRDLLYRRIEERVERMFERGLLVEAKRLLGSKLSRTASCAIGLKELRGYLDGAYDKEEGARLVKRNSRQYAKRQLTWFRKNKDIEWVKVGVKEKGSAIAKKILQRLSR
ncbi:MAG: tRNA (adenosine(37)-N6)-dimethylallyltransferase MiaA [Candidatus Omnitrophica bacterium]|nr:tRNA (adenosine(37)-N6)-dimethylallyltransferase MiaA [Candidatus Omnitrophota bacterium]